MYKKLKLIFFIIGLIGFSTIIYKVGFDQIYVAFTRVGPYILPIFLMQLLWYFCDALGWYFLLAKKTAFLKVLRAYICGETMNDATPSMNLAGEPVKGVLLASQRPMPEIVSSLVVDNSLKYLATLFFVATGFLGALVLVEMPQNLKWSLAVALILLFSFLILMMRFQKRGLMAKLVSLAQFLHLPIKNWAPLRAKAEAIDKEMLNLYQKDHLNFYLSFGFHFLSKLVGVFDTLLILTVLGVAADVSAVVFIQSVNHIINLVFAFIPMTLGAAEGSHYMLFNSIALGGSVGVIYSLVRRVRTLFWIGVGLVLMAVRGKFSLFVKRSQS